MKTKLLIVISVLFIISINIHAKGKGKDKLKATESKAYETTPKGLSNKKYYKTFFSRREIKQLKKADKNMNTANKYLNIYRAKSIEIKTLARLADKTNNPSRRKKTLKKLKKLRKKAHKKGLKAIKYFNKSNNSKIRVYNTAISKYRNTNQGNIPIIGSQLELQSQDVLKEVVNLEELAAGQNDSTKIETLLNAKDRTLYAIKLKEQAIANYNNDTTENKKIEPKKNTDAPDIINIVTHNNPNKAYDPNKDNNIYNSRANLIIPKLGMSSKDMDSWHSAKANQAKANSLSQQVDVLYAKIDSLRVAAELPENDFERIQIKDKAANQELLAFSRLLQATKLYSASNKKKYETYAKYLPRVKANKPSYQIEEASKYEKAAIERYKKALSAEAIAKKLTYNKPEQYIKLMGVNDLLLQAIQLQEEAFSIYLGLTRQEIAINNKYEQKQDYIITENTTSKNTNTNGSNQEWQFESRNVYSKERPKIVPYRVKNGTVFTVQVGIFKGILPPSRFGNVQPIIFDKFINNIYRRFMVGEYRSIEAAKLALAVTRKLKYTDSYIVALVNGQRQSFNRAINYIKRNTDQYNRTKNLEIAKVSNKEVNTYAGVKTQTSSGNTATNINGVVFSDTDDVSKTKGLLYFVQLGMFKNLVSTKDQFPGLAPIIYENVKGRGRRYMLGTFGKLDIAQQEASKLKAKGYKGAFVTSYYDGKHVGLDLAKRIEKEQYSGMNIPVVESIQTPITKQKPSKPDVIFSVQLGAYSRPLSEADLENLKMNYSSRVINHKVMNGKYIYYIGNYNSYKEATYLKNKLQYEGHKGVFVIAHKGSKKIPLSKVNTKN